MAHPQYRPEAEAAFHRRNPAFHLRRHAGPQVTDGREPGPVLVAQRQVQPQILQGQQSTGREFFRKPVGLRREFGRGWAG